MTLNLRHSLLCLALIATAAAQDVKPCDSSIKFDDRNMVDYTIRVKALTGHVIEPGNVAVPKDCIALFNADHSQLLRTAEATEEGKLALGDMKNGDYWLLVQDPQRAFCPATARVQLKWYSRKSRIVVQMKPSGIDQCSYCEAK